MNKTCIDVLSNVSSLYKTYIMKNYLIKSTRPATWASWDMASRNKNRATQGGFERANPHLLDDHRMRHDCQLLTLSLNLIGECVLRRLRASKGGLVWGAHPPNLGAHCGGSLLLDSNGD